VATGRRLTEQGRERREQLLAAAGELFAERGYQATRIADICERAGAAKGLFYWYFDTKEALFADLVRDMRQRLRRAQAAAIDPEADPLTQLRQGTESSVRFMADHRSFFALLEGEQHAAGMSSLLSEGTDQHAADTAARIAAAQRAGLLPDHEDPMLLALGVVGAVGYFSHWHRSGRIDLDADALAAFVADWVLRALAGEVPAPLLLDR
jgi:TetR/AcrR family transcriptional regulator, cholesterol catabolism regulator